VFPVTSAQTQMRGQRDSRPLTLRSMVAVVPAALVHQTLQCDVMTTAVQLR